MKRRTTEDGAVTTELVVATPLFLLLLMLIIQFAIWEHAQHVAQTAAVRAARATRLEGGSINDGQQAARLFLNENGSGIVLDPDVVVTKDANVARVEVSGHAENVVPWLVLPIKAVSEGQVEVYR